MKRSENDVIAIKGWDQHVGAFGSIPYSKRERTVPREVNKGTNIMAMTGIQIVINEYEEPLESCSELDG